MTPAERPHYFARLWTLKEAYLKALGLGLTQPLDRFEIGFEDDIPCLVSAVAGVYAATPWSLHELSVAPGYAGALCVEGADWELCARDYAP